MNHTSGPARRRGRWTGLPPRSARPASALASEPDLHDEHADLLGGWADVVRVRRAHDSCRLPLFADLEPDALELVLGSAHELRVAAGETVIHRWQGTRHFYAILEGDLEIRTDTGVARTAGPGEFFGELAALDWGAGFGYARTATVVAASPARLLVLAPSAFGELIRMAPAVEQVTRAAARQRLRDV